MARAWGRLTGLVAGILVFATQASAQGPWPGDPGSTSPLVPGQLFVGFGAQVGTYNLPKFESPWRSAKLFTGPVATDLWRPSYDADPTVAGELGSRGDGQRGGVRVDGHGGIVPLPTAAVSGHPAGCLR